VGSATYDSLKSQTQFRYYKQVVILGGGYDTRSLRFHDIWDANDVRGVFEVDLGPTQAHKLNLLRQAIEEDDLIYRLDMVKYVVGNLNDMSGVLANLTAVGYNPTLPTIFVMEGLLGYLPPETVNRTFELFKQYTGPSSMAVFNFGPWINSSDPVAVERCYGIQEVFREISRTGEAPQSVFPLFSLPRYLLEFGLVMEQHFSSGELEHRCLKKADKTTLGRVGCWEHMAVVRNADDTPAQRPPAGTPPDPLSVPYAVPKDLSFAH